MIIKVQDRYFICLDILTRAIVILWHLQEYLPSRLVPYSHQWQPRLTISHFVIDGILFPFQHSLPLWHQWKTGCPKTPPVKLLLFMNSRSSWVCYSLYHDAFLSSNVVHNSCIDIPSCDEPSPPVYTTSSSWNITFSVIKWKRSSIIVHEWIRDHVF